MTATATVVSLAPLEVLDASELAPIQHCGRWFAHRLVRPDEVEARQAFEAGLKTRAENRLRNENRLQPRIGWRVSGHGFVVTEPAPNGDGELQAEVLNCYWDQADLVTTRYPVTLENAFPKSPVDIIVRRLCKWLSEQHGHVTQTQTTVANDMRTLLGKSLMQPNTIITTNVRLEGRESVAGWIDFASTVRPGMEVWTNEDAWRATVGNNFRQGGLVLAVERQTHGDLVIIVQQRRPGQWRTQGIDARNIHQCSDPVKPCAAKPNPSKWSLSTMRQIFSDIGGDMSGNLTSDDLRHLNYATTIMQGIL
jgi:hypothetical protein